MPIDLIFPELKDGLKMFSCRMVIYFSTHSPEEKIKTYRKNNVKFLKKYLAICRLKPRKKKNISEIVFDIADTYLARPKPRKEGKTFLKNILKQRRRQRSNMYN